jgi:RNA polymerase sigma-70 factor (ECF subfamily)
VFYQGNGGSQVTADEYPTLVERLQNGEEHAAVELVAAYRTRIYQIALRYVRNHEDAEEVTQDVLMKVFRSVGSFRGDAALTSWIYRITFNAAISHLRRLRSRRVGRLMALDLEPGSADGHGVYEELADSAEGAADRLLRAELRRHLAKAVYELPPLYRAPVVLRDIRGLSTDQASVALEVNSQTLKSRLHRGRTMLRERLADLVARPMFDAAARAA